MNKKIQTQPPVKGGQHKSTPLYAGIDLHGNNCMIVVRDAHRHTATSVRTPNQLRLILQTLKPYQKHMAGIAVESTYNTYWLIDGLADADYRVHLAHPPYLQAFRTEKYCDDTSDATLLADLLAQDRLPQGYIYPRPLRGLRDLFRRRMLLVQHRTALLLSLQSLIARHTGEMIEVSQIKGADHDEILHYVKEPMVQTQAHCLQSPMTALTESIKRIEKIALAQLKPDALYQRLSSWPGFGPILSAVVRLEIGSLDRFATVGDFVSYVRCAPSQHLSNGQKKGEGNRKNGNRYLAWAFLEAAHCCCRYCAPAKRYYERKKNKRGTTLAIKALAAKLARSVFVALKNDQDFDEHRAFGFKSGAGKKVSIGVCGMTASV